MTGFNSQKVALFFNGYQLSVVSYQLKEAFVKREPLFSLITERIFGEKPNRNLFIVKPENV